MASLQPLQLADRDTVSDQLEEYPPKVSEHTFTNLHIWRDSREILWCQAEKALIFVERADDGLVLFGPPVGPRSVPESLDILENVAEGPVMAAERIDERSLDTVREHDMQPESDRDNYDYVYRQEKLAELPGRHMHSKRNLVERCLSAHDCRWERIEPELMSEVADLQDRWCDERNCGKVPGLCAEYQAIQRLLDNYEDLEVCGGAVRVDGTIQAYTIGEALSDDTAVVHVEKAMPDIDGLYQVVNQWFCREELGGFEYVNREQDLGIRGIRKAKKSYRPDHMVRKYSLQLQPGHVRADAAEGRCG